MTKEQPKLKGQGGPGRGQGRKKGRGNKGPVRPMISLRLPPEIIEKLRQEEDYTALIEKLLREYYNC